MKSLIKLLYCENRIALESAGNREKRTTKDHVVKKSRKWSEKEGRVDGSVQISEFGSDFFVDTLCFLVEKELDDGGQSDS